MNNFSDIFSFNFNSIALLFLLCGVIDFLLIVYIHYKKITSLTAVWFMIFCLLAVCNALSQAFLSMSINNQTFIFWALVNNFSIIMTGIVTLFFVLSFVGKDHYLKKFSVISCLLVIVYTLVFLMYSTDKVYTYNIVQSNMTPWGRMPHTGELIFTITLYFIVITIAALFLLFRFYASLKEKSKRQQAKLVITGFMILLVGSIVGQGIIPQVLHVPAFPLSIILNVVLSSLVAYSLSRYGSAAFNIGTIGERLLELIPNAVILLDTTKNIERVNPSAENLFHAAPDALLSKSIKEFFLNDSDYDKFESTVISPLAQNSITQIHDLQVKTVLGETMSVDVHATTIKDLETGMMSTLLIFTSIQAVKDQSKELEQKFKEIEEQKKELERMNKIMVGRELRMVELKKENEELKKQASK